MQTYSYTVETNKRFGHLIDVVVTGSHENLASAGEYEGLKCFRGFGRTGFTVHPDNLDRILKDLLNHGHKLVPKTKEGG